MRRLLLLLTAVLAFSAIKAQIYVSPTGDNSNPGTEDSPLANIQNALYMAGPGDTIFVMQGEYHERIWWGVSGSVDSPIVLTNYQNDTVIIDGTDATNDTQDGLLVIGDQSNIVIENMIFRNNIRDNAYGIYYLGSGDSIVIRNCEFYNIGWTDTLTDTPQTWTNSAAVIAFVGNSADSISHLIIENNYIHHCAVGYNSALLLVGNISDFLLQNNKIYTIPYTGMTLMGGQSWTGAPDSVNYVRSGLIIGNEISKCASHYSYGSGIYLETVKNIDVVNNVLDSNDIGLNVYVSVQDTVQAINVHSNLFFNNNRMGLMFGGDINQQSLVQNSSIANNTFYHNTIGTTSDTWAGEMVFYMNQNLSLTNNIVIPDDYLVKKAIILAENSTQSMTIDYNLYWRETIGTDELFDWGTGNSYTQGSNELYGSPDFVDLTSLDFHLTDSSVAIDAGDPAFVPLAGETDIDGELRVQGAAVDIGADEFTPVVTQVLDQKVAFMLYPNPAKNLLIVKVSDWRKYEKVRIYSASGKLVKQLPIRSETMLIPVADLAAGQYVVKVGSNTLKFIKL